MRAWTAGSMAWLARTCRQASRVLLCGGRSGHRENAHVKLGRASGTFGTSRRRVPSLIGAADGQIGKIGTGSSREMGVPRYFSVSF